MKTQTSLVFIFALVVGLSCSKNGGNVTTQLLKISAASTADIARAGSSEDIYIDSYQYPIVDIALSTGTALTGSNASTVYLCSAGSSDGCLVDIAAAGAVENLLTSGNTADLKSGSYRFATVSQCGSGASGYKVYVKARVKKGGTWWYTTGATGVTTPHLTDSGIPSTSEWMAPTDYAAATQSVNGCRTYNVFQQPITITEGTPVTLKLFFELRGLLSSNTSVATFSDGNCFAPAGATSDGSSPYLCGNTVYLAGTIESETPDLHRYRVVTNSGTAANIFGIYFKKGTSEPVGAYNLGFFDSTFTSGSGFNSVLKSVASSGTNTLEIHSYGGATSTDEIDELPGDFNTTTFPVLSSVGATDTLSWTDENGTTFSADLSRIE